MKKRIIIILFLLTSFLQVSAIELCQNGANTNLEITKITNIQNKWSWLVGKEVEINLEVKNKNYSQRDFEIELFFYNENEELEENFTQKENLIKIININETESKTINFTFKIDDVPTGTYSLYAKLTDKNNGTICTSQKAETKNNEIAITLTKEERLVTIRRITGPTTATANSSIEYTVEIINLGNRKEDRVIAIIYNANFKLREEKEITNLDIEQSKNITFNFTVPATTLIANETILFSTEFDYNNKTKQYQKEMTKDKPFTLEITSSLLTRVTKKQNQSIEQNQSQLTTTQVQSNSTLSLSNLPYLWITIILLLIIIIITATIFYLKRGKALQSTNKQTSKDKVNEYLKKIKNKPQENPIIKPQALKNPTTPNKPSETNIANTKAPPTSQNPPQQPRSPSHPATISSSPKSNSVKSVSPPQAVPSQPQKNQPSPQPPKPNKTS